MEALVVGMVGLAVLGLALWAGHRMLMTGPQGGGGSSNALGGFSDVFEPARARSEDDLRSKEHQIEVTPSPDDEDPPVRIDAVRMRVTVRRPKAPPSAPPELRAPQPPPAGR